MSGPQPSATAPWSELPPDLWCQVLRQGGGKAMRLISKAIRDSIDNGADALSFEAPAVPSDLAEAQKVLVGIVRRSPALTRVSIAYASPTFLQHLLSLPVGPQPRALALSLTHLTATHLTTDALQALAACVRLQHLDISGSRVGPDKGARELATALGAMQGLTHLNASECALGPGGAQVLGPVLGQLSGLQHLLVSRNRLGAAAARMLDSAADGIYGLKTLDVRGNRMGETALADVASSLRKLPALQRLLLSDNDIDCGDQRISSALMALTNLQVLELGVVGCGPNPSAPLSHLFDALKCIGRSMQSLSLFWEDAAQARIAVPLLADTLQSMPNLHTLNLEKALVVGRLTDAIDARVLGSMPGALPSLRTLNLAGCSLRREGAAALSAALSAVSAHGPGLLKLDLTYNGIGDKGMAVIASSLQGHRWLQALDLAGNLLGPAGMASLAIALRQHLTELQHLNLRGNIPGLEGMRALAAGLTTLPLQILNLSEARLNGASVAVLTSALGAAQLQHLNLSENVFGHEGASALAAAPLPLFQGLRELLLEGCGLEEKGCEALAPLLHRLAPQLRVLNLSDNGIEGLKVKVLTPALAEMRRLVELHFADNHLGHWTYLTATAVKALLPALEAVAPSLRVLDLSHTWIESEGLAILSPALSRMGRLSKLWLRGVLTDGNWVPLTGSLSSMHRLSELDVSVNRITPWYGKAICKALQDADAMTDVMLGTEGNAEHQAMLAYAHEHAPGVQLHF